MEPKPEPKRDTRQYVVIVGTMFGNKTIHGPFSEFNGPITAKHDRYMTGYDVASKWMSNNVGNQHAEIVALEPTR